ncbi:helix-turn-helix domain-containing protein [Haladaptatus sp. CMAA 1911]|uniref:helix-turn-helix domain-containing protein n=1 Tax=unclassified Haladaptatus TaxID=2622732 RepID=UPI0037545798
MEYIRARIGIPESETSITNLAAADGIEAVHLLAGGVLDTDTPTYTLSITGPEKTVRQVLKADPDVLAWEISGSDTEVVYVYVQFHAPLEVRLLRERFTKDSLIVLLPVTFYPDSVELTVVGAQSDLSCAIKTLPSIFDATVCEVGTYRNGIHRGQSLTQRQREVLKVAYDFGYYERPSETSHEEIADVLGCAPSTVGEHLQKAEKRLVKEVFT